jgi:hypothetical protein
MAQINLLKQSSAPNNLWQVVPKFLVKFFAVVLIGLIAYYAWLYFQFKSIENKIEASLIQINSDRQEALNSPQRDELLTRQSQLKYLDGIISQHLYWSQLLPKLANVTLKKAAYVNLNMGSVGKLTLSVNVPTLADMDKYLQIFDLPEVNKYFSDVRIGSYHKVLGKTSESISFEVNMQYNPSILQYTATEASN